jgi:hypothetical protein
VPALVLVVGLLAAGCTHAIPLNATLEPPPDATQVPLAVGVYYDVSFETYEHAEWRGGDNWVFPLGPASVRLFDHTFPAVFKSTQRVTNRPPVSTVGSDLVAVIEPRIEEFAFTLPFIKTGQYTAEITYRFTIYSPRGDPVASWTETGWGEKRGKFGYEFARWPGEAADLAMQDAATKFLLEFQKVPEVKRWLRGVGTGDGG